MPGEPVALSLVDELAELEKVLESAELLADLLANAHLPDSQTEERAPLMVATIIDLALNRVRLLRQVVLQEADPRLLLGRRNTRPSKLASWEDPDVLMPVIPRRRR